jgi:DNA repair exonuclease SbcCD ATPase subunit
VHQVPVEQAEERRSLAQHQLTESLNQRDQARETLRRLEEVWERRTQIEAELGDAHRRRARYHRLADLLGRGGLQGYLMNTAIQGISHLANETLARISGGQLQIQILRQASVRGEGEIVIQATDLTSSDAPLDVQFISGSQQFRTSVALAAGIGQYAGRGIGSVRSLIIDEGFGSLDSQGRQEMIDELRNLSNLMDRVIVVSHQEDFQDRTLFPTGYLLRKDGQRTTVERFV